MFTINIYLRFALIAAGFILGIGLWMAFGFWYGFPFLTTGIVLLAGYFLLGTVLSSFQMIQAKQFDAAEKQLALTKFPKLLLFMMRSQYYMAKSTLAMQRKDFAGAENLTQDALSTGFSSDDERAIAFLQLAGIAANKGNINKAQGYMADIKKLTIKESMIKEEVKKMEQNLKVYQQNKAQSSQFMGMQNGFRPGSKKPRPKVR
jgi:hypothetical protein